MAGLGAAMNTGNVSRGDSVAVIGCGGVGDVAIAGARLAGASAIIAIDRDPKKLQWATELGATFVSRAHQAGSGRGGVRDQHRGEVLRSVVVL